MSAVWQYLLTLLCSSHAVRMHSVVFEKQDNMEVDPLTASKIVILDHKG